MRGWWRGFEPVRQALEPSMSMWLDASSGPSWVHSGCPGSEALPAVPAGPCRALLPTRTGGPLLAAALLLARTRTHAGPVAGRCPAGFPNPSTLAGGALTPWLGRCVVRTGSQGPEGSGRGLPLIFLLLCANAGTHGCQTWTAPTSLRLPASPGSPPAPGPPPRTGLGRRGWDRCGQ